MIVIFLQAIFASLVMLHCLQMSTLMTDADGYLLDPQGSPETPANGHGRARGRRKAKYPIELDDKHLYSVSLNLLSEKLVLFSTIFII